MNTHDIELPPLPQGEYRLSPDSRAPTLYDEEMMEAYARAAIEADRKRKDEPVGYINPAYIGQGQGSGIFWAKYQSFNKPVYEAPQPDEPVKVPSVNPPYLYSACGCNSEDCRVNGCLSLRRGRAHGGGQPAQPVASVEPQVPEPLDYATLDERYVNGWNDCRAAMLKAAPTPPNTERK